MSALAAVHWGSMGMRHDAVHWGSSAEQCSAASWQEWRRALRALGAGAAAGAKHSLRHLPFLPPPCCSLPPISL